MHFELLKKSLWKISIFRNDLVLFSLSNSSFKEGLGLGRDRSDFISLFWLKQDCRCVWELHPCNTTGLCAVSYSVFILTFCPLSVLSQLPLQGVAQDVMLSRTHRFILSDSLWFLCVAKVSCSLHSSEACSPSCLCCGSASLLYFDFVCLFVLFLGWLFKFFFFLSTCFLLDCQTPRACLVRSLWSELQLLKFCGWLVGLSLVCVQLCQLLQCCDSSSFWTMCKQLNSFLVWHRLPQCHIEVMLQEMTLGGI